LIPDHVLARLRKVPSRLFAAFMTFGLMLGAPAFVVLVSVVLFALGEDTAGAVVAVLSVVVFFAVVAVMWTLIFQARARIKRAETALYTGDYDAATRDAHFVVRTVFRSDYQMGALFILALAAERLGAFIEAGTLFMRAFEMIPAMAAQKPGRRARALFSAHAALDFAAANDLARAHAMLARCHLALGAAGQPGAFELFLDDSGMGAIGINSMLVEMENRREPRPLAVLAWMLVSLKGGQPQQALAALGQERAALGYGLAPHEQALAARIESEATRMMSGASALRSPAAGPQASTWAEWVV
jgi:hypothetical protein